MATQYIEFATEAEYDIFEQTLVDQIKRDANPGDRIPAGLRYSTPIRHPRDGRVIAKFDGKADITGRKVVELSAAITDEFLKAPPVIEVRGDNVFIDGVQVTNTNRT